MDSQESRTEPPSTESSGSRDHSNESSQSTAANSHTKQIPIRQSATTLGPRRVARALGASLIYHYLCSLYCRVLCRVLRRRHRNVGQPVEEKKKAIEKNGWTASQAGSIHFLPMVASFILLFLNLRGFYIGQELEGPVGGNDFKLLGLQFAAKLHELTITASLTAVLLYYIRKELMTDTGLPFGAIVAGLQYRDVSYLWSMEFRGAVHASWRGQREKTFLILLIVMCAVLALSAGPSSATLMRPRLDYWPAGGTDFWIALPPGGLNITKVSATPVSATCMNDTGDLSCPSGGWQILAQDYMSFFESRRLEGYLPDYTYLPGKKAVIALRTFIRSREFQFWKNQTQATMGSSSVADGLVETGRLWAWAAYNQRSRYFHERFWSRIDAVYSVEAHQPIVHARCKAYNASDYASDSGIDTSASTVAVYDLSEQDANDSNYFPTLKYNYTDDEQVRLLIQNVFNGEFVPQVAWSTVPQLIDSALGATLNVPIGGNNASMLFQCTIAARMAPGTLESTRNNISLVTGADHSSVYENNNTFPRVSIEPAWAAFLNPTISSDGSTALTAFQYMMQAAGILDDGFASDSEGMVYAIESLLSLSVVNGLARQDFGVKLSGTLLGDADGLDLVSYPKLSAEEVGDDEVRNYSWPCDEWCSQLVPSGYRMGYGGNAFNINETEKNASTKFTMRAGAQGWAFNRRGSAAKFAMVAQFLYMSIALSHLLYTVFWTKKSSSSWDSIAELVALAMESDPSEALKNTGAGINTGETFEQQTRVVCKDQRLQLAVGGSIEDSEGVEPGTEYA